MNQEKNYRQQEDQTIDGETNNHPNRRQFLKKYGKLALYTPPAMVLLMSTQKETVVYASSGGGCWDDDDNDKGRFRRRRRTPRNRYRYNHSRRDGRYSTNSSE